MAVSHQHLTHASITTAVGRATSSPRRKFPQNASPDSPQNRAPSQPATPFRPSDEIHRRTRLRAAAPLQWPPLCCNRLEITSRICITRRWRRRRRLACCTRNSHCEAPPPPPPPFRLRGRQRFFKHHGGTVVVVHRIEPRSPSRSAARPTATSQQPSVNSRPASRVAAWADSHHARPTAPALGSTGNIAGFAQCGCLHGKDGSLAAVLAPSCGGSPTSLLLPRRRALAARHRRKQKPARGRRS